MSEDEGQGQFVHMTMEEFLRFMAQQMVEHATESEETKDEPTSTHAHVETQEQMKRGHDAIQKAILTEYRGIVDRALATDAVMKQPDLTIETAGRGYALHYLCSRLAATLAKHSPEALDRQEFEAQRLEHQAMIQRWMPILAGRIVDADSIDAALEMLRQDQRR